RNGQQQQQQHQSKDKGSSNKPARSEKPPKCGKHSSKKHKDYDHDHDHTHITSAVITDLPTSQPVPLASRITEISPAKTSMHKVKVGPAVHTLGKIAYPKFTKAMKLASDMEIDRSPQVIRNLEPIFEESVETKSILSISNDKDTYVQRPQMQEKLL
ncbi:hypothetical protein HWV62_6977, partial [Athelia sp. TMB]